MIAPTQMKKPSNWQDFEKLCKLLWGEIWNCEDSIKRNGRQGQNQHGVDVYAYVEKYSGYCGIQCKGKDDYTKAQLTEAEIDKEIENALGFDDLKLLIFATTANKDAKIESYVRKKNIENREKGLLNVDIASWEDIVDHLERYRTTFNWYVNNCQFKDATDVSVSFNGEEEIIINPQYVKTTTHYVYRELTDIEKAFRTNLKDFIVPTSNFSNLWSRPRKIDKRWCKININIENSGSTVIKTPKLLVYFREKDIIEIDDRFYYCNEPMINDAAKAQINASRDAKREVFQTCFNVIEFRPKETVFVQEDDMDFSISIKVKDGVTMLPMGWRFLCEDYKKEGCLKINVEPAIEEIEKIIEVYDESELKPDEVKVEPKIVEE